MENLDNNFKNWLFKNKKEDKKPIYKGCPTVGQCFCTGKCKEVIGYSGDPVLTNQEQEILNEAFKKSLKNKPDRDRL